MNGNRGGRSSSLSRYLNDIRPFPLLTREQEQEAALRMREMNGSGSHDDLVLSNLRFVVKIASEYRSLGLPLEDLVNEGNIGLIEAARRFDPARGTKFLTYAVWWIRQSIQKALARHTAIVHVPSYQLKKARDLRSTRKRLVRELGRQPDREDMSKEMRLPVAKIEKILQAEIQEVSLDDRVGREGDIKISDRLTDDRSPSPEAELIKEQDEGLMHRLLGFLGEKDQTVLMRYYGLTDGRSLTFKELGRSFGITREGVRQIEKRARERLRMLILQHQAGSAGREQDLMAGGGRLPHRDPRSHLATGAQRSSSLGSASAAP